MAKTSNKKTEESVTETATKTSKQEAPVKEAPKKDSKTTTATVKEPVIGEDYIIQVMESLGFKKYRSGNSYYFLPKAGGISQMKKISADKVKKIFGGE